MVFGKKYSVFALVISDHKDTSKRKRTAPAVGMLSPVKSDKECAKEVQALL
jgi:hypothetical protein